jgi:2-polyprenyl-3-methyl-5-hydroxy-6-metoxy-1,4-benzoquinol methylase
LTASRYTAEISLENVNTTHSLAILEVSPRSSVLDIGAADGSVARGLQERGCRVTGVESDSRAAAAAERVCERVLNADVEDIDLAEALNGEQFDFVLLLDVLEHLRDPLAVLSAAADRLAPGGRIVLSVPNVTHAAVRLELVAGRFQYTETGLLDRTHLHFFDRPALERLIEQAGLHVLDRMRVTAGLTETEIAIDPSAYPAETVELAMRGEDADTYQFVYVVSRAPSNGAPDREASLGEALQRRANESERLRAEAEQYVQRLEERVTELEQQQGQRAEREDELRRRAQELEALRLEVTYAQRNLEIKDAQLAYLQAELAPLRQHLDQLEHVLGYARHRLVDRASAMLKRVPVLHRLVKRIVELVARR